MLIRIRSSNGTHRIEVNENETLLEIKEKIRNLANIPQFSFSKDPSGKEILQENQDLKSLHIKHGDMLFLKSNGKEEEELGKTSISIPQETEEDEIDGILSKQDGWIERERDPQVCRHGRNARCTNCMPLAPWEITSIDPWKSEGVKFIPFHSYLRKLQADSGCKHLDNQKCLNCKAIDQPSYRVKPCKKHPPWPDGICTECRPSACRIDSQNYRHVDNVEFESGEIIQPFLQYWREKRSQRCGFLYGKYVVDDHTPLGIRANVSAIYEPPQKNSESSVSLLPDPDAEKIDFLASQLGLQKVGYIWSDIQINEKKQIIQNRVEYLLTSNEIIQIAKMQNKAPSPCKRALSGKCGSKFISVIATGNAQGQIDLHAYQVSDQCMALVKDGIITSTQDPLLLRTKKTSKRFIPDVMYNAKNEYNIEVTKKAEPTLPTEFFIIRVGLGAPKKPKPFFKRLQFPIENREQIQPAQAKQIIQSGNLSETLSDFHLLVYLSKKLNFDEIRIIARYVLTKANEDHVKFIVDKLFQNVTAPISNRQPPEIDESLVPKITTLGYTESQAKAALLATGGKSLERAVDFILSQ